METNTELEQLADRVIGAFQKLTEHQDHILELRQASRDLGVGKKTRDAQTGRTSVKPICTAPSEPLITCSSDSRSTA